MAPQRTLPQLARQSFRAGFRTGFRTGFGERAADGRQRDVLLWPDTFNNHFHPEVLQSAAEVLLRAGLQVRLPPAGLCCGRPLYEFGFLDAARQYLQRIVDVLGAELSAGTPIVVLEPACLSVFKCELPQMLPRDEHAKRLAEAAVLLPDFLEREAAGLPLRPLGRGVLVHAHCHHKTVLGFDAERALLRRVAGDVDEPDTGCCGMAGSFGFEAHKYDVSMRCAERVLLPAVRATPRDALVVTDGYSCREQIVQGTGRDVRHLAQVLHMALDR